MNKKIKITLAASSIVAALAICSPMLTSCSISSRFVFGNFQSYMSPEVKENFDAQLRNVNWQNFTANDEIPTYLTNKTINAAVASNNMIVKLSQDKMIKKIDWTKFNLVKNGGGIVQNATDLNGIVTNATFRIATEGFKEFGVDNLLDYCFPYFLQNFVFVYRGAEIPELSQNPTFSNIFKVINSDPRFKSNKPSPNVMMIKDSRTMYGLAQILHDEKQRETDPQYPININPDSGMFNQKPSESRSIKELNQDYNVLKNSIKNIKVGLNSDSNVLINKIVLDEIKGAFMYNGDAAFAALGGDYAGSNYNGRVVEFPKSDDFHVVVPNNTLYALDGVVINSENNELQDKEALKVGYDLTMLGANVNQFDEWNKPLYVTDQEIQELNLNPTNLNILQKTNKPVNNGSEYLFLPTKNFQYVNYTPTLQKLYTAADAKYFQDYLCSLQEIDAPTTDIINLANLITKIMKIDLSGITNIANFIEKPLNKLTESNMQVAFTTLVDEIPG